MISVSDWVMQLFQQWMTRYVPVTEAKRQWQESQDAVAAAHEVGHALVVDSDPFLTVTSVTIENGGGLVKQDISNQAHEGILKWALCAANLAGLAGEVAVFGRFRSGRCEEDLMRAKACALWLAARHMPSPWDDVGKWQLPFQRMFDDGVTDASEVVLQKAYRRARRLIHLRRDAFDAARARLERQHALSPADIRDLFGPKMKF